jgi:hypothetical protein
MWHSFIHRFVFYLSHIYSCVKHVFNIWYLCAKCTNLWMNELCTISIINLSHVKFVMYERSIVVTYEIRVFFEGAQKEVFSSIFKKAL